MIPNARFLAIEGAGHRLDRSDWDTLARAILEHTADDRGRDEHVATTVPTSAATCPGRACAVLR
jgi:hypothetical protein